MKKERSFKKQLKILKYEGLFFLEVKETNDKESYYCLKLKKDFHIDLKYLNSSHVLPKNAVEVIGFLNVVGEYFIYL